MKKCLFVSFFLCLICAIAVTFWYSNNKTSHTEETNQETQQSKAAGSVDLDLTVLSSTMVYAYIT